MITSYSTSACRSPGRGVTPPFSECLEVFDFDGDRDLDLRDAAGFARSFSAP